MDINYQAYNDDYQESLVDLLHYMWSSLTEDEIVERFKWRYLDNYCMDKGMVYIAVHENKIIGFRGFTAQVFLFNGVRKIALTPSDAIVHPDYRRVGIFNNLTKYALESLSALNDEMSLSVYLNLSSNEKSTPGYLKLGWQELCKKRCYTKVFFKNIKSIKIKDYRPAIADHKYSEFKISVYDKIQADIISEIKHLVDYPIVRDKSQEYYDWRYDRQTGIYFIVLTYDDIPKAFAIVERKNKPTCYLYDYAAESPKHLKILLNKTASIMKAMMMRILIMGGKKEEVRAIKNIGFIGDMRLIDFLRGKKNTPILIKQVKLVSEEDIEGVNWSIPENWRIVKSDVH